MLIEAAKGGHTNVVHLLLDYPRSIVMQPPAVPLQRSEDCIRIYNEGRADALAILNEERIHSVNKTNNNQKPLSILRKIKLPSSSEPGLSPTDSQQVWIMKILQSIYFFSVVIKYL